MPLGVNNGDLTAYGGLAVLGVLASAFGLLLRRLLSSTDQQSDRLLEPCYKQLAERTAELGAERVRNERFRQLCIRNNVAIPEDLLE